MFSFNTFDLRVIIKIFNIIICINTLINNQQYILFRNFYYQIFEIKHAYQNLIQCTIKINQNFVEKIVENVAQNENVVVIVDILSNAIQFEFKSKKMK